MTASEEPPNQPTGFFFSVPPSRGSSRDEINDPEFLRRFDELLSQDESASSTLRGLLALGAESLCVENGHLTEIDPAAGTHTIIESSADSSLPEHATRDLSATYCRIVIAQNAGMGVTDAEHQGWRGDPAYETFGFSTYLGAKVVHRGTLKGTLCFVDRSPRSKPFTSRETAMLALLVGGVEEVLAREEEWGGAELSRAQLEAVFRESPTMLCVCDAVGNILAPNPEFVSQMGYSVVELMGMTVGELVTEETRSKADQWMTLEPGDRETWDGAFRRLDGSTVPVEGSVCSVEVDGTKQFVIAGRDVSEERQIEEHLRQREQLYHETLRNITDTVVITRDDGTFTYVCPNVHHIFGYEQEDVEHLGTVSKLLGEDPAAGAELRENGALTNVEQSITDAHGERHDLLVNVRPVSIQDGTRLYTCRDVTERKAAERKQRRAKRLLEKTFQSLSEAVFIVDPDERRILTCNEAAGAVFGYDRDELVGQPTRVLHVDETAYHEFGEITESVLEEEGAFRGEYRMRRKDGTIIETEHQIRPLKGDEWPEGVVSVIRDITDRKQAERDRREQEKRLRDLANSIPGVVIQFFARDDGTYGNYFVSEHAETVLGIPADPEVFFDRFVERVPPGHRDDFVVSVDEAVETGTTWRQEIPFVKPSGEQIWLLGTTTPRRRENEIVFDGVLLDITEQKEAERALREERNRFATLFHNLPTPVVHGHPDDDGRVRVEAVNESFETVFGYSADEIRGTDIQRMIVPQDERSGAEALRRRLLSGESLSREVRRETADGIRDFRLQVALRQGEEGPRDGFAIYTDITERKRREQLLARRTALLEAQAESTIDGLLVVDREGEVVFFNDRFSDLWGLWESDVKSGETSVLGPDGLVEVMSPLLVRASTFRETVSELRDHPTHDHREVLQLRDGRWIDFFNAPIRSDDGEHFGRLWVCRDVTDQRRMQERLLEVQEEERRRIDEEIHNNLGGLLTALQLHVDGVRHARSGEGGINEHIDQIEDLVRELSTLTRTISRKLFPTALDEYGLSGTLPTLADEVASDYDLKVSVDISLDADDRFSTLVERTAYWIVQEALLNVVRHAETDRARVRATKTDQGLFLEIADEGVGFDPDEVESEKGIGLESIRRRVEQLNGDMSIRTSPASGTVISTTLPVSFAASSE